MIHFRIIGDVHGKITEYIALARQAKYSVQLGDLGFDYSLVRETLDPACHRVLGGNHDNYEADGEGKFIHQPPHFLGDYGSYTVPGIGKLFFVRGANSIDKRCRKEGVDWWPAEEMRYSKARKALQKYAEAKPDFMITHECPKRVLDYVSPGKTWWGQPIAPSMTANLLDQMLEIHQPKYWYFGHHHNDWSMQINGTNFCCLAELSYADLAERPV